MIKSYTQLVVIVENCQITLIFKGLSVMMSILFYMDNLVNMATYPHPVDKFVDIYFFCVILFSTNVNLIPNDQHHKTYLHTLLLFFFYKTIYLIDFRGDLYAKHPRALERNIKTDLRETE